MNADDRLRAKLISICLRFPDEELLASLNDMQNQIPAGQQASAAEVFAALLPRISNKSLIDLQEEYTRLFDLSSSTCMNLTYHKLGDSRDRGQELVKLKELFRAEGLEPVQAELPDFLPMLLEFISVASDESVEKISDACRKEVTELADRVAEQNCSYSGVLSLAAGLFSPEEGGQTL